MNADKRRRKRLPSPRRKPAAKRERSSSARNSRHSSIHRAWKARFEIVTRHPPEALETTLTLNGATVKRSIPARQHLIDFLREEMGLTGSHVGCEHGVCGTCTVRVDGRIVRGCLMLAVQADGRSVDTIEGLSDSGELADLQEAFHRRNALQCGYCTPGMLLAAQDLVVNQPGASRERIREHLSGNYCRCTGYQTIVDAVEDVLSARRQKS